MLAGELNCPLFPSTQGQSLYQYEKSGVGLIFHRDPLKTHTFTLQGFRSMERHFGPNRVRHQHFGKISQQIQR